MPDEGDVYRRIQALGPRPVEDLRDTVRRSTRFAVLPTAAVRQIQTTPNDPEDVRHSPTNAEDALGSSNARSSDTDDAPKEIDIPCGGKLTVRLPSRSESRAARPNGPNSEDLRPLIVAAAERTEKCRFKWRRNVLFPGDADESEKDKVLFKKGRLQVASCATLEQYLFRAHRLFGRYKWETSTSVSLEDFDPRDFVDWLLGLSPMLTDSTWRGYRAYATALIQSVPSSYTDQALGQLYADLKVGSDKGPRAGAQRMGHGHFQQLKRSLKAVHGNAVEWLRDWLDAGIHTGIRTMEWPLTIIERRPDRTCPHGERIWLHVVSEAAAQWGATVYRTLDISNFSVETLGAVERLVERSRASGLSGCWASQQSEVSRLFRRTCETLFPRMLVHYTLYSLRHQFIENMKSIYSREQVAALGDHLSIHNQLQQYAKRRPSWSQEEISDVPVPVEDQVARVTRRLELLDDRKAIKQAAKARRGRRKDQ
jgi:hypothetical protein